MLTVWLLNNVGFTKQIFEKFIGYILGIWFFIFLLYLYACCFFSESVVWLVVCVLLSQQRFSHIIKCLNNLCWFVFHNLKFVEWGKKSRNKYKMSMSFVWRMKLYRIKLDRQYKSTRINHIYWTNKKHAE